MSHTPGPWVGFADRGQTVAILAAGRPDEICEFSGPVKEDDATLMIAAPKLLAELKKARAELEAYELAATGEMYNSVSLNAAIAEAEGALGRSR